MTLGDAWGREPDTDPTASPVQLDYYRNKVLELQRVLNALDTAYRSADEALNSGALTLESQESLAQWMADYLDRRDWLRNIAATVVTATEAANAVGVRMPVLSLPSTLGALPLVGLATVIAAAAVAITWGMEALRGYNERSRRLQLIESASPAQRQTVIDAMQRADSAVQESQTGTLAQLAPMVKYAALAAVAWFAWRAYKGGR